jgi:branched-chain amino acid transport system ATP-binding protein
MPILDLIRVSKAFEGLQVLKDVSFSIEEGEIVGLIGANGAGKTTLFNVISGILRPSSGSIKLGQHEIGGLPAFRICHLGVARTFQVVRPFTSASVGKNVEVAALYGRGDARISDHDLMDTVSGLLDFVGLKGKSEYSVSSLGLVELKQLELARALATDPRLLLLDETFSGLTPTETRRAMDLILRIRRERRVTILWVEHVMRAIMRVAERVVVLDHGIKIAEGRPAEIAANPDVISAYLGPQRAGS